MRFCQLRVATLLLAGCVLSSESRAVNLLRDINTIPNAAPYLVLAAVDLANVTLFVWDDGIHGQELWATDGTPAGTHLVRDINPGPASPGIRSMVLVDGIAYFWADDGTNGVQLWRSDGTTAGTYLVAITTPNSITVGAPLVAAGSVLYFAADDGQTGMELWRSDGTAEGTYLLKDIAPGSASSNPANFTAVGAELFFSADDGVHGVELWATDGTPAGTHMVVDAYPGSTGSYPRSLTVNGNTLYFVANTPNQVSQLWRATPDGSSAALIPGINSSVLIAPTSGMVPLGKGVLVATSGELYAAGGTGAATDLGPAGTGCPGVPLLQGSLSLPTRTLFSIQIPAACTFSGQIEVTDLWTTDGTAAGTGPLNPGQGIYAGAQLYGGGSFILNGVAYFTAYEALPGTITKGTAVNIWRSDGTLAGTQQVTGFTVDLTGTPLVPLNGHIYFEAGNGWDTWGAELWSSDGTTAGTTRVTTLRPGPLGANVSQLLLARGRLFFTADDGIVGAEPWSSDGTAQGTQRLVSTPVATGTQGSLAGNFIPLAGGALFVANDGVTGGEPWFTDGTAAGTHLIADIAPGAQSSNPNSFVSLPGQVLFTANDGTHGARLWRTDGTTTGTYLVANASPGVGAAVLNGVAYLAADDGVNGLQLWRSDGTTAGTYLFDSVAPAGTNSNLEVMDTINGHVVFAANVGSTSRLWASDGTVAGTAPLRLDMSTGISLDHANFNGYMYFQGVDSSGNAQLWRTDGTAAGTTLVQTLGSGSSMPNGFASNSHALLFNACVGGKTCQLFGSLDPASGVTQLGSVQANGPIVTDGTRFFFADSQTLPSRLVITDGTLAGTSYLQGNLPFSGVITQYVWFAGSLVMTVEDTTLGPSIWATDGTAAGTHLVAAIDPGKTSGHDPGGYLGIGSHLFFGAYQPVTGDEPWIMSAATPNADDDVVSAVFNTTARFNVLSNDGFLGPPIDPSSVEIVAQPALGMASVDTATGEIIYTPNASIGGEDTLQYIVKNTQGVASNVATVYIAVANPTGPSSGTAPSSPPPPAPGGGSGGGHGGGGTIDPTLLALLGALILFVRTRFAVTRNALRPKA